MRVSSNGQLVLWAAFALTIACSSTPSEQPADLLVTNGKVYTAVAGSDFQEAIAVRANTIVRVGRRSEVEVLRGPETQVIDAKGGAVVPGFIDSHVHFLMGAQTLDQVSLRGVRSPADVQQRVREFVAAHPDREWIRGWGYFNQLTRHDLDPASGDKPVLFIAGDGHSMLANTKALALAGITKNTPNPEGGEIVRDPKTKELTGVLKETAQALMSKIVPTLTQQEMQRLIEIGTTEAHRAGVTSIVNVGGTEELDAYDAARRAGALQLRIDSALWLTKQSQGADLPETFDFTEADAERFNQVRSQYQEDSLFKTGMVKVMLDGVIESNTAAMLAPYANQPGVGHANYTQDELNRVIAMMDRHGWQVMTHALGDRAVRMALDAYEHTIKVNPEPSRGRRHKIEHIETIDPAEVPRFAKLGVIASLQPAHAGGMNNPKRSSTRWINIGYERSAWDFPGRALPRPEGVWRSGAIGRWHR